MGCVQFVPAHPPKREARDKMPEVSNYRVLVAGSGSIGRRHMRNLYARGITALAACDADRSRMDPMKAELGVSTFENYAEALDSFHPDVVFVCTPPVLHVEQATAAVLAGAHVFVEKPLSHSLNGIDRLQAVAREGGRVVQVGYNMRFHPGVRKLKELVEEGTLGNILWARAELGQYLPDWRPWQDYRKSYTARRELGGGIILDASHEIDYVLWMLGTPVEVMCMAGRTSRLEVDVEDCATILLRFAGGAQADIHLDFVQRTSTRSCKLAGELGSALWDLESDTVTVKWPGERPAKRISVTSGDNDTYLAELDAFFACLQEGRPPLVDLDQAARVVDICVRARAGARVAGAAS